MATLAELDLDQVLGMRFSSSVTAELVGLDARLDRLERGVRRNGWVVGHGGRNIAAGQPAQIVLDRTMSYRAAVDDSLELSVNVWQREAATLLVDATVEVYCFCPDHHHIDRPAEREWTVRGIDELRDAMAAAVARNTT